MINFINVGIGNVIIKERIKNIIPSNAIPVKRIIDNAKKEKKLVDATCGRKTKSVVIMEKGYIVLSALTSNRLDKRCVDKVSA